MFVKVSVDRHILSRFFMKRLLRKAKSVYDIEIDYTIIRFGSKDRWIIIATGTNRDDLIDFYYLMHYYHDMAGYEVNIP